jgi:flagellar basal-body rod protein FlgG
VGTLRVVDFPKPYALLKEGDGMFVPVSSDATPEPVPNTQVIGGALEESNVNAVRTMVNMIELLRRYETAQRVVQAEDEANRYTTTEMGRLA